MKYGCFMQGCYLTSCLFTCPLPFSRLNFCKPILICQNLIQDQCWRCAQGRQQPCLFLCQKKKICVFDCMQYFYLIISKCYAHKTSLSMGSNTMTPSQGSHCFRTSFEYRRKYELALTQLNKVIIPRWRLEVFCIQIQCIVKPIIDVWPKLICDAP